jgi:predicted nuclease of predicted toxin-antitoxin system
VKFLLDEDVAVEAARCLRQAGHEVALVADALGTRTDDVDIWRHAVRTDAIVVTCNRQDFLALAGQTAERKRRRKINKSASLP